MILTFESPTGNRKWKIQPHGDGLCFEIFKSPIGYIDADGIVRNKYGVEIKRQWTKVGRYPVTIEQAVEMVVDLMISDPDDTVQFEFHGIELKKGMERIFKKWLKEVEERMEVLKDAESTADDD